MNRGSISLFLALLLTICLTFSLVCLEDARVYGMKTRLEAAGESAMDSLFAAYDGDLFSDYGLMAFSGDGLPGERSAEEDLTIHLKREMNPQSGHLLFRGNFYRAEVAELYPIEEWALTERGGELFIRSALDYMKYSLVGIGLEELLEQIRVMEEGEQELEESETSRREKEGTRYTESGEAAGEDEEGTGYAEATEGSWLEKAAKIRENGWLELIIPIERVSSGYETDKRDFPSENYLSYSRFFDPLPVYDPASRLLFTEYLLESFTCFTTPEKTKGMQYQLEYLLSGKRTDRKNLEGAVKRLLLLREGLDFASLMASERMRRQTEAVAVAIAGWTGIAPIIWLVQTAVAAAWAFGEAIVDVRTLLGGGKVPLIKRETEWVVTAGNIPAVFEGNTKLAGKEERGMEYTDYLRIVLFLSDMQALSYRAMDVIQENIRRRRPDFAMDRCLYALSIRVRVEARPLFFSPGKSRYSFAENFSRMY